MTSTEPVTLPLTRQCPDAPPPEHLRLREEAPISRVTLPSGMTVWALTRHEDIRAMLADPRFSSDRNHPGFPAPTHEAIPVSLSLLGMDPPAHGPARRAVMGEFTLKRITALRPRIQQIVDERIDALLAEAHQLRFTADDILRMVTERKAAMDSEADTQPAEVEE